MPLSALETLESPVSLRHVPPAAVGGLEELLFSKILEEPEIIGSWEDGGFRSGSVSQGKRQSCFMAEKREFLSKLPDTFPRVMAEGNRFSNGSDFSSPSHFF